MAGQPVTGCVVYVVEDDHSVRDAICTMLRSRKLVAVSFESAEAFEAELSAQDVPRRLASGDRAWPREPSVLLLDLRMPGMSGLALFERLLQRGVVGRLAVIFLTGHGDVSTAVDVVKRGAFDFIEKPFTAEGLFRTVRAAASASHTAQAQNQEALHRRAQARSIVDKLTRSEAEVTYHALKGLTSREIATTLATNLRTVEGRRKRAYEKLNVASYPQLANFFRETGIDLEMLKEWPGDE